MPLYFILYMPYILKFQPVFPSGNARTLTRPDPFADPKTFLCMWERKGNCNFQELKNIPHLAKPAPRNSELFVSSSGYGDRPPDCHGYNPPREIPSAVFFFCPKRPNVARACILFILICSSPVASASHSWPFLCPAAHPVAGWAGRHGSCPPIRPLTSASRTQLGLSVLIDLSSWLPEDTFTDGESTDCFPEHGGKKISLPVSHLVELTSSLPNTLNCYGPTWIRSLHVRSKSHVLGVWFGSIHVFG